MLRIPNDVMCAGGDAGFGATKTDVSDGNGFSLKLIMPSTISESGDRTMALVSLGGEDPILSNLSDVENQLTVLDVEIHNMTTGDTNSWFIGRLANKEGIDTGYCWQDDKSADKKSMALLITQLALAQTAKVDGINSYARFYLATGLPIDHYKQYKDSYAKNIKGKWRVTFKAGIWKDVCCTIEIGGCRIYPQVYGIWNDHLMDIGGSIANADLLDDYVLVVDPGTRTTDYAIFKEGRMIDGFSGSLEQGMSNVLDKISNNLKANGLNVKDYDLDYCFVENGGWVRGKNINQDKRLALKIEAEKINDLIKKRLKDSYGQIGVTLVGGGCGEAMFEYLQFPNKKLTDNAQFGNATGFLKFAMEIVSESLTRGKAL